MNRKFLPTLGAVLVTAAAAWWFWLARPASPHDPKLQAALESITGDYRKIIVLMDGADALDEAAKARAVTAGRMLFWRKQATINEVSGQIEDSRKAAVQTLDYVSNNPALHDADKLAFLDLVDELEAGPGLGSLLPHSLSGRIKTVKENLASIQLTYREEVARIF